MKNFTRNTLKLSHSKLHLFTDRQAKFTYFQEEFFLIIYFFTIFVIKTADVNEKCPSPF